MPCPQFLPQPCLARLLRTLHSTRVHAMQGGPRTPPQAAARRPSRRRLRAGSAHRCPGAAGWERRGGAASRTRPCRLTGVGRGRQAAGGGDGREEDEGAGRRHLVQDGKKVEVVAAGEEGGAGPQPPAMGTRATLASPRPKKGGRRRRTRRGRGCLLAQVPPAPSAKGRTDKGWRARRRRGAGSRGGWGGGERVGGARMRAPPPRAARIGGAGSLSEAGGRREDGALSW